MISKNLRLYCLIFLFLSSYTLLFAQENNYKEYHININKASISSDQDSVIYYFKVAFKLADPFPKDLLNLSYNYYKRGDLKKADKYFNEAICNGYQFENDKETSDLPYKIVYDFRFLEKYSKSNGQYSEYMRKMSDRNSKKMRRNRQKFLKSINLKQNETYEVLLQNEYYFQYLRLNILPQKDIGEDNYKIVAKYLDSGNSYILLDLLKNGTFPKRKNCVRFNDQTITLLLNHAIGGFINASDAKEFIELLWLEVENGNLTPYDYAKAYDHYVGWYINNKFTYFGTTTYLPEGYNSPVCMDVLYPEKLNSLRRKHWLNSIEEFCSKTGFHLPLNYE